MANLLSDPTLNFKWRQNMNRRRRDPIKGRDRLWENTQYSKLCQFHFTDDCFEISPQLAAKIGYTGLTKLMLKPDAVPTIFDRGNEKKPKHDELQHNNSDDTPDSGMDWTEFVKTLQLYQDKPNTCQSNRKRLASGVLKEKKIKTHPVLMYLSERQETVIRLVFEQLKWKIHRGVLTSNELKILKNHRLNTDKSTENKTTIPGNINNDSKSSSLMECQDENIEIDTVKEQENEGDLPLANRKETVNTMSINNHKEQENEGDLPLANTKETVNTMSINNHKEQENEGDLPLANTKETVNTMSINNHKEQENEGDLPLANTKETVNTMPINNHKEQENEGDLPLANTKETVNTMPINNHIDCTKLAVSSDHTKNVDKERVCVQNSTGNIEVSGVNTGNQLVKQHVNAGHQLVNQHVNAGYQLVNQHVNAGYQNVNQNVNAGHQQVKQHVNDGHQLINQHVNAGHQLVNQHVNAGHQLVNEHVNAGHQLVNQNVNAGHQLVNQNVNAGHQLVNQNVNGGYQLVISGNQQANAVYQNVNGGYQLVISGNQQANAVYQNVNAGFQYVNNGYQNVNAGHQLVNAINQHVNAGYQQVNTGYQQVNAGHQHYIVLPHGQQLSNPPVQALLVTSKPGIVLQNVNSEQSQHTVAKTNIYNKGNKKVIVDVNKSQKLATETWIDQGRTITVKTEAVDICAKTHFDIDKPLMNQSGTQTAVVEKVAPVISAKTGLVVPSEMLNGKKKSSSNVCGSNREITVAGGKNQRLCPKVVLKRLKSVDIKTGASDGIDKSTSNSDNHESLVGGGKSVLVEIELPVPDSGVETGGDKQKSLMNGFGTVLVKKELPDSSVQTGGDKRRPLMNDCETVVVKTEVPDNCARTESDQRKPLMNDFGTVHVKTEASDNFARTEGEKQNSLMNDFRTVLVKTEVSDS